MKCVYADLSFGGYEIPLLYHITKPHLLFVFKLSKWILSREFCPLFKRSWPWDLHVIIGYISGMVLIGSRSSEWHESSVRISMPYTRYALLNLKSFRLNGVYPRIHGIYRTATECILFSIQEWELFANCVNILLFVNCLNILFYPNLSYLLDLKYLQLAGK